MCEIRVNTVYPYIGHCVLHPCLGTEKHHQIRQCPCVQTQMRNLLYIVCVCCPPFSVGNEGCQAGIGENQIRWRVHRRKSVAANMMMSKKAYLSWHLHPRTPSALCSLLHTAIHTVLQSAIFEARVAIRPGMKNEGWVSVGFRAEDS